MAPPRVQFDPVPNAIAGALTIACECGWEMVVIQPEEDMLLLTYLFHHLEQAHQIQFPKIFCYWH